MPRLKYATLHIHIPPIDLLNNARPYEASLICCLVIIIRPTLSNLEKLRYSTLHSGMLNSTRRLRRRDLRKMADKNKLPTAYPISRNWIHSISWLCLNAHNCLVVRHRVWPSVFVGGRCVKVWWSSTMCGHLKQLEIEFLRSREQKET